MLAGPTSTACNSSFDAPEHPPTLQDMVRPGRPETLVQKLLRNEQLRSYQGLINRWWTQPGYVPRVCPITQFPICLLPYPPFKLREELKQSAHCLVDGKFLALSVIVSGCLTVLGRELIPSDLSALDEYVHRCKLGPWRQERAIRLRKEISCGKTTNEREAASQELTRFIATAKKEMNKLRRIQEIRLKQLSETLPANVNPPMMTPQKLKGRNRTYTPTKRSSLAVRCDRNSTCARSSSRFSACGSVRGLSTPEHSPRWSHSRHVDPCTIVAEQVPVSQVSYPGQSISCSRPTATRSHVADNRFCDISTPGHPLVQNFANYRILVDRDEIRKDPIVRVKEEYVSSGFS